MSKKPNDEIKFKGYRYPLFYEWKDISTALSAEKTLKTCAVE